MKTLPPLFISHGSPMTALEPREAGHFMQRLGPVLIAQFERPRAVLVASAHSLAHEPALLAAAQHQAVYDFGGFDPKLKTLRYDAPGAPDLATRALELLRAAGLPIHSLAKGGLDHGIWTPLRYMFPAADIPVLPLAWPQHWSPAQLFKLGQALSTLTEEGVLVLGSGSITHNLQRVFAGGLMPQVQACATPESTAFRDWFVTRGEAGDWPALLNYRRQAPYAVLMHPSDEHLLPFYVAAGAAAGSAASWANQAPSDTIPARIPALRIHASLTFGDLGMDAYAFGAQAAALQAALAMASPTTPA